MSEIDRDILDSVLLEVEQLIDRLNEADNFKTIIQICEAIISTIEEAELD